MKKAGLKTLLIWGLLLLAIWGAYLIATGDQRGDWRQEEFATLATHVAQDFVAAVHIDGNQIFVELHDGADRYQVFGVVDSDLMQRLSEKGAEVRYGRPDSERSQMIGKLMIWLPLIVLVLVVIFFMRRMQGGTKGLMTLTKSKAKLVAKDSTVRFEDVGGAEEAKEELRDVVDFLKHPSRWKSAGVRLPTGILLEGPPGCGKTLLARAVAGEAGVPMFFVSASEFVEMFVGVGAARVRDMFEEASKKAPCIVFIDELDAVGRRRGSGVGSANDEREQTLNQLLVSLDGFEKNEQIVVICATNRPDVLDTALTRSGRLDRRLRIPMPDEAQRLETLKIHTRDKPLAAELDLAEIARQTDNATGADLENLSNEAALLALRRLRGTDAAKLEVTMTDFEVALEKRKQRSRMFDKLDTILIESASQLSQPTGNIRVRVTLKDEERAMEGTVVWADAAFVKLQREDEDVILPKSEIVRIEPLSGTERADEDEVTAAAASTKAPELA